MPIPIVRYLKFLSNIELTTFLKGWLKIKIHENRTTLLPII